jgi:alkanesulfonate monooxygenase SsuD/methylene tetrahydromethanopterin reductase-like flavin-dependent oxidoreductase (luciferase family)
MHVGAGFFFQGIADSADHVVYQIQMPLIAQAEAMGFGSIWTPEHHFTRYHMMPNPAQFLAWVAGMTRHALVGSMVMIIPWHNPIRVAEEISVLDILSGGRVVFGVGRGLGPIEFDSFQLEMGESRQRFIEYASAISGSLETGVLSSEGPLYRQPPVDIRPRSPFSFRGRSYAIAVSPESAQIMARLGYGLMLIAQKPWDTVVKETREYAALFESINGYEAPGPILVNLTSVDRDAGRARALHDEYTVAYARSTIEKHGVYQFNRFMSDLQISGTPQQVIDATVDRVRAVNAAAVVNVLTMGGMTEDVARTNFLTYATDVLPVLKGIDTHRRIGRTAAVSAYEAAKV